MNGGSLKNMDALFHRNSLIPRMTAIVCLICVVIFIGLHLSSDQQSWANLERWGYFPTGAVWSGKPWTLITSVFVHLEIWHIAFNLYWTWLLGNVLEDEIGPWKWLVFFLAAAWVSSACQLLFSGDTGIGLSGVGYALFGFGWVARPNMEGFRRLLDDNTVKTFVIWMVGCAVATQMGWVNIGNAAHASGLVFGAAVGAAWVLPKSRLLGSAGVLVLAVLSVVPLFWCPLSPEWNWNQASTAYDKKDYRQAIYWYQRSLARGVEPAGAWNNIALSYGLLHDSKGFNHAVQELAKVDKNKAAAFEGAENSP